jgi:Tol biopolymer transport system component
MSGLAILALAAAASLAARPMELEDMFRLHRVSDPQISPDGSLVAFVVTEPLKAENRTNSDIWLVSTIGGEARKLTNSAKHDRHPRWSPDGQWIAFESNREGSYQIWVMPAAGGEARKLTSISTEASQPVWSPDGKHLAFVSAVLPEFSARPFAESDRLNQEKLAARENSKVKAKLFDTLLYRHWDSWVEDKRQHVFVLPVRNGAAAGEPRDVTPGENDGVPTSSTFSEGDEFAFAPDGQSLVFTAPPVPLRTQAWSTNHDIFSVNLATGEKRQLTTNPAADGTPQFSPDGKLLAYRAQARPGFEADRWQLMLLDLATGQSRSLTETLDRSVDGYVWSPDAQGRRGARAGRRHQHRGECLRRRQRAGLHARPAQPAAGGHALACGPGRPTGAHPHERRAAEDPRAARAGVGGGGRRGRHVRADVDHQAAGLQPGEKIPAGLLGARRPAEHVG